MASTSRHVSVVFLLLAVLIGFLSASVSAGRPCKTLFISSYTVSLKPLHSFRYPNPNFGRRSAGFVAIVTEFGHQSSSESSSNMISDRAVFPGLEFENHVAGGGSRFAHRRERQQEDQLGFARLLPFGLSSHEISSLRDRTKDILSVVVALLFGVGCGALTAATMYLVWSLFAVRSAAYYDELYDDEEEEEEEDAKKIGYVKIPEAEKVAAPAKAVV
ncbi:unnamed protein product [Linum tenue]|uniref:Transmembrane protein n=1 Tax=Linum tenue TaxID=586396 RepID=A0AAV0S1I6_9ROSI|nr:unnamed protein product [Linum tenue]